MKKIIAILISMFLIFTIGCSNAKESGGKIESKGQIKTQQEFSKMYSSPDKYKDYEVDFYAKILFEPEKDDDGTYIQCYAYDNDNYNTLVGIEGDLDIKEGDIVHIKGVVKGAQEGENMMGATITAPVIMANNIDKSDYATAFAPAVKTKEVNQEQNQHGYVLKVNKVEFAENETRIHVTVTNNTKDKINFYSFNAKATQGSTQIKEKDNFDAKYKEIESEIMPGITEEGIVLFEKADKDQPLKLYFEGSSENYDLDFQPFVFDVQ
ncbi:hypothetical protein CLPU_11c00050 [Gottschalkia purinilytica]|uniref:DUF4352 domain-containing protein n=1 Tax=Gottschalkia purinilytica TaxID=1503 RepID=A0A0L0W8R1_GOTPU|nr:DUF4352 domain-containing protein [Gottschalkia purinilytica]KNF07837.1 hypothetical protein CLPU_11c00050 [Gottschalkia purinilytica]